MPGILALLLSFALDLRSRLGSLYASKLADAIITAGLHHRRVPLY